MGNAAQTMALLLLVVVFSVACVESPERPDLRLSRELRDSGKLIPSSETAEYGDSLKNYLKLLAHDLDVLYPGNFEQLAELRELEFHRYVNSYGILRRYVEDPELTPFITEWQDHPYSLAHNWELRWYLDAVCFNTRRVYREIKDLSPDIDLSSTTQVRYDSHLCGMASPRQAQHMNALIYWYDAKVQPPRPSE